MPEQKAYLFLGYPKCSTSRKAERWLQAHDVPYHFRDIKLENPTRFDIEAYWERSGLPLRKLFNTSGMLYREMELSKKLPNMTEEEMLALLAADGMLVKRPILVDGDTVLVGFSEEKWQAALLA